MYSKQKKKPRRIKSDQHVSDAPETICANVAEALFDRRVITIYEEITQTSMMESITQILLLNVQSTCKPITILVNSGGGDMHSVFGLVDVIRSSKAKINTVCVGMAASAGAMILAAGHKRYALPSTQIMVHSHWQAFEQVMTHHDLVVEAEQSVIMHNLNIKFYQDATQLTISEVEKLLSKDSWLTPERAKELNLIDHIGCDLISLLK